MIEFEVEIPARATDSYKVRIGSGLLAGIRSEIEKDFAGRPLFVVTDENVAKAGYLRAFSGPSEVGHYIIEPPGEVSKTIDTVTAIVESMETQYLGRDTVVVALGGGTVGDIGAFAASIFKRGVPVVHIPTTTVSQADSSIGGKTGVDSSLSKNAFGTFWHPAAVYIDVETLKTLDERQYRAGLVESVKHALIADSEYFEFLESNVDLILQRQTDVLEKLAEKNCRIKAQVVQQDPYEKNKRRILNYGHTIGHAVESVSRFKLLHGEAVAIGIIGAGLIENQMQLSTQGRLTRIRNIFERLAMPVTIPKGLRNDELTDAIKRDKKTQRSQPRFVLIEDIGKVYCRDGRYAVEVPQEMVNGVLEKLKA